jgi:hypothetical protein
MDIVFERFVYQRRDLTKGVSLSLKSVEYIGVIRLYAAEHIGVSLHMQTPAQAKNLWTDDKLRKLDLYHRSSPHIRDATRHMLYFLTVTRNNRRWVNLLR